MSNARKVFGGLKAFFHEMAKLHELGGLIILSILAILAIVVSLMLWPFVSHVGQDEIVVKSCSGNLTVWRAPDDQGFKWDGFCRTRTYHEGAVVALRESVDVEEAAVTVRAQIKVAYPGDDVLMRALYREYTEKKFLREAVEPAATEDVRAAAADPAWHEPQGGWAKRGLKTALNYSLQRLSPTGVIWSDPEAKRALEKDIQRRLNARIFPHGVRVKVTLGFVTEHPR